MAQTVTSKRSGTRAAPIPKALREQAEHLLAKSYDYMDSPLFHRRNIEKELFSYAGSAAAGDQLVSAHA